MKTEALLIFQIINLAFSFILNDRVDDSGVSSRIIHGNEAVPHSYPWQCGLITSRVDFPGLSSICGGGILSKDFVLTSALCLQNTSQTLVIAGAHRMFDFEPTHQRFYVDSSDYIIHPDYNPEFMSNDIALLRLATPAVFNDYVQPIALPPSELLDNDFVGQEVQSAGWGRFSDWTGSGSEVLRVTRNFVIETNRCSGYFGRLVSNVTMCLETYKSRRSTCRGDHGSPIVWKENESSQLYVAGVVSFGVWVFNFGCDPQANNYIPTVNTLITHFVPWINEHLATTEQNKNK